MPSWRCDPYLWVHLAGLATVPLWIDLCLLGLAVGNPTLPNLELGVIAVLGVLPVLVMQLRRPFYIFSLPGVALRPASLHDDQRRLLTQFRGWRVRLGVMLVPVPLIWTLVKLYPLAFLAREVTPFGDWGRLGGVAIAAVSFLMANLFSQVPVTVLQVLATSDRHMQAVTPYPTASIATSFTWLGLLVDKLLPTIDLAASQTQPAASEPLISQNELKSGNSSPLEREISRPVSAAVAPETLAAEQPAIDQDHIAEPRTEPEVDQMALLDNEVNHDRTTRSDYGLTAPGSEHDREPPLVRSHPEIDVSVKEQQLVGDAAIVASPPVPADILDG